MFWWFKEMACLFHYDCNIKGISNLVKNTFKTTRKCFSLKYYYQFNDSFSMIIVVQWAFFGNSCLGIMVISTYNFGSNAGRNIQQPIINCKSLLLCGKAISAPNNPKMTQSINDSHQTKGRRILKAPPANPWTYIYR